MENIIMREKTVFNNTLASIWPDFVNCKERLTSLGPFLNNVLNKHRDGIIYDAALGIGCESIFLIKNGFKVISNEIDETLINIAINAAKRQRVKLNITKQDWRDLCIKGEHEIFDALIVLGNSMCLLDDKLDILNVLNNFYKVIIPGGTIVIDERNFPYILNNRKNILSGDFRYSYNYIYCGKDIKGLPIKISNNRIIFGYYDQNKSLLGTLDMYPFKIYELVDLLREAGFSNIRVFSDFKEGYSENADFFFYTATK